MSIKLRPGGGGVLMMNGAVATSCKCCTPPDEPCFCSDCTNLQKPAKKITVTIDSVSDVGGGLPGYACLDDCASMSREFELTNVEAECRSCCWATDDCVDGEPPNDFSICLVEDGETLKLLAIYNESASDMVMTWEAEVDGSGIVTMDDLVGVPIEFVDAVPNGWCEGTTVTITGFEMKGDTCRSCLCITDPFKYITIQVSNIETYPERECPCESLNTTYTLEFDPDGPANACSYSLRFPGFCDVFGFGGPEDGGIYLTIVCPSSGLPYVWFEFEPGGNASGYADFVDLPYTPISMAYLLGMLFDDLQDPGSGGLELCTYSANSGAYATVIGMSNDD